ncbi:MAG TPA: peptide chain release factor N(5)-glutamine methyltransferase [Chitinophagaceae bacterium]|nr:peptide chain release factor N(5)-glutamine methyltransferase [Chitinophagaceae bacterium]
MIKNNISYQEGFVQLVKVIENLYPENERHVIANWAMDYILGTESFMWKIQKADEKMSSEGYELFLKVKSELGEGRPIQYIIGKVQFYGSEFVVNEHVLIPRPETEELIDWVIKDLHNKEKNTRLKIVDLGTGSGIIPITLKRMFPSYEIKAYDIDEEALKVTQKNAELNNTNIEIKNGDILNINFWKKELGEIDILISNPPYALDVEKKEMEQHVLKYEPLHAIFVQTEDPLQFYKCIEEIAQDCLKANGVGYLELSSLFAEDTRDYYLDKEWQVELKKDLLGKNRMLKYWKN